MKLNKFKLNKDFRRLYGRGKSFVEPSFVTYVLKNGTGEINLGITAGKKIGGAVERNRAKRVLTAAFRENMPLFNSGCDVVLVARTRILSVKSTEVAAAMKKHFKDIDLIDERSESHSDSDS